MNNNENFDLGCKLIIHEEYILPIHNLMTRVKRILHYKSRKTYVIAKARYVVLKQFGVMTKVTGSTARGRPPTLLINLLEDSQFPHTSPICLTTMVSRYIIGGKRQKHKSLTLSILRVLR